MLIGADFPAHAIINQIRQKTVLTVKKKLVSGTLKETMETYI